MKKIVAFLLITLSLFALVISSIIHTKNYVSADESQTYEEADRVSIGDLNKTKSITLKANQRFYYEPKATYGSLVLFFDINNILWGGNTMNGI